MLDTRGNAVMASGGNDGSQRLASRVAHEEPRGARQTTHQRRSAASSAGVRTTRSKARRLCAWGRSKAVRGPGSRGVVRGTRREQWVDHSSGCSPNGQPWTGSSLIDLPLGRRCYGDPSALAPNHAMRQVLAWYVLLRAPSVCRAFLEACVLQHGNRRHVCTRANAWQDNGGSGGG